METRKLITTIGLTVVFAIVFLLTNRVTVNAADCRVIRIFGMTYHESVRI